MATVGDATVRIKADTRQFNRELRRVQFSMWMMKYGEAILVAAAAGVFGAGFVLGALIF